MNNNQIVIEQRPLMLCTFTGKQEFLLVAFSLLTILDHHSSLQVNCIVVCLRLSQETVTIIIVTGSIGHYSYTVHVQYPASMYASNILSYSYALCTVGLLVVELSCLLYIIIICWADLPAWFGPVLFVLC